MYIQQIIFLLSFLTIYLVDKPEIPEFLHTINTTATTQTIVKSDDEIESTNNTIHEKIPVVLVANKTQKSTVKTDENEISTIINPDEFHDKAEGIFLFCFCKFVALIWVIF